MTWTSISKPVGTSYTNLNADGKTQYDQSSVTYDDPTMFYDGINPGQWTDIAKPALAGYGSYTWNELSIIWDNAENTWENSAWINIDKPT